MKISKVNHTKAAVSTDNGTQGILYTDPGEPQNLKDRFRSLNSSARLLYSILNPVPLVDEEHVPDSEKYPEKYQTYVDRKKDSEIISILNTDISKVIFRGKGRDKQIRNDDEIIRCLNAAEPRTSPENYERCLQRAPQLYLRKSLKKEQAGFTEFLKGLFGKEYDRQQVIGFISLVRADFGKSDFGKKIIKSVRNQNMILQPFDGLLTLSGKRSISDDQKVTSNASEKEGLRIFLSSYADLDEKTRMDHLRRIRRLLDMYFASPESVSRDDPSLVLPPEVRTDDFNPFADHENGKANEERFVSIPDDLTLEYDDYRALPEVQRKKAIQSLREAVRKRNIVCYIFSTTMADRDKSGLFFPDSRTNYFFIHHIEKAVERILEGMYGRWPGGSYRLGKGYLKEKVWKDIINLISVKYIATGKAVYNFAMDDLTKASDKNANIELGKVSDAAKNGISSFDYEMIHARETIQRETAVKVLTAANNLARATVDLKEKQEDLFTIKDVAPILKDSKEGSTIRAILQFFGGASTWDTGVITDAYQDRESADAAFLSDLKNAMYSLRNASFHFNTKNSGEDKWDSAAIGKLFSEDARHTSVAEKKKFYFNNLPMFYKQSDLKALMNTLYDKYVPRASQVPSFNTVFVRKDLEDFVRKVFGISTQGFDDDSRLKLLNGLYYLMKEIYYNGFLGDQGKAKKYFLKTWNTVSMTDTENKRAVNDFGGRLKELEELPFDQICQAIMTEFNAQNAGQMKKKTARDSRMNPDIFQHYRLFLHKTIRQAFADYLSDERYSFIRRPEVHELPAEEDFLPGYSTKIYDDLAKKMSDDQSLQKWYVTARFLSGRDLNHLSGSVRSYIQYAEDVDRRAEETGNTLHISAYDISHMNEIAEVLDFCLKTANSVSHEVTDYFRDEDDYAAYLSRYLDYGYDENSDVSHISALDRFCNTENTNLGIYMDGKKPILNRNIIMAKLFGPERIVSNAIDRVDQQTLKEYLAAQEAIADYRKGSKPANASQQQAVLHFQRLKNRVEFRDVEEYGEIINELMGQLVNFSYLRERDLLYFQLGFHYVCLNNDSHKPQLYRTIDCDGRKINGAILYQIAAMYINGLGLYKGDVFGKGEAPAGSKIGDFLKYTSFIQSNDDKAGDDREALYNAGLEVFENIHEHDDITALRNYIDHFKYYTNADRSILDIYGEVFDRFFTYDMKYQKNVMNIISNILLSHFVIAVLRVSTKKNGKAVGKAMKDRAQIDIKDAGLYSDAFTYKLSDRNVSADARNGEFLANVARILYYPESVDADRKLKSKSVDIVIKENRRTTAGDHNNATATAGNHNNASGSRRKGGGRPKSGPVYHSWENPHPKKPRKR